MASDRKLDNLLRNSRAKLTRWLRENWEPLPNDIRIGIWGTSGTGKTTFLTMLYHALTDAERSKWLVSVDEEGRRFFQDNFKYIEEDRKFPPSTEVAQELEIFRYTLTPRSNLSASYKIVLNFIDAPGAFYEDIYRAKSNIIDRKIQFSHDIEEDATMNIIDYLISCDGIVFLLDPERSNKDSSSYSALLRNLFLEFQQRCQHINTSDPRLEQYMAFCVTKVDHQELWNRRREAQKLAEDVMGRGMSVRHLQTYCRLEPDPERRKQRSKNNRCEFFCVSSIGRYLENGELKPAVVYPDENNSQPGDNQRKQARKNNISPGYDPNHVVNTPPNSSSSQSISSSLNDSWIPSSQPENFSSQNGRRRATILDVDFHPYQVIEPIEWLIEGIRANPPSRFYQR